MEEINIKEFFNFFLGKFYIVIIVTFCAIVISVLYGVFLKTPMYQSYTTLVLAGANVGTSDSSITQSDITLNQKLVPTYREIIKSRRILSQVIENLSLSVSPESLASNVTVTSESNTELIRISVSNEDALLARDIANEIAEEFSKEIVEIYNIQNVSVIDKAVLAKNAYNINFFKQLLITILIALVLSFGDIFVLFYFDTSIKSAEDVEKRVGLPILGSIPDSTSKGGVSHEKRTHSA